MNFSDVVGFSGLAALSPNGEMLAFSKGAKVILKQLNSFSTICQQSLAGLQSAYFSPTSRHVLTITEFCLRLTVWSLVDQNIAHIKNPKFAEKGLCFSSDGKFMALAERHECKDFIGIYYTQDYTLVNHFGVDTFDLHDMQWSPDDSVIAVWDASTEYVLLIYSIKGTLLARHQPYTNALGIKSGSFSPSGQFLVIGSFDQSARIFSYINWMFVTEFKHVSQIDGQDIHIYQEEEYKEGPTYGGQTEKITSRYVMIDSTLKLALQKPSADKPNSAVSALSWSNDSKFLATKCDAFPSSLWIWDMQTLSLQVILNHFQPIKSFQWNPTAQILAFCTSTGRIFIWSPEGASVCDIPLEQKSFCASKIEWSKDGKKLLITDKSSLIVAYPQFDFMEQNVL